MPNAFNVNKNVMSRSEIRRKFGACSIVQNVSNYVSPDSAGNKQVEFWNSFSYIYVGFSTERSATI